MIHQCHCRFSRWPSTCRSVMDASEQLSCPIWKNRLFRLVRNHSELLWRDSFLKSTQSKVRHTKCCFNSDAVEHRTFFFSRCRGTSNVIRGCFVFEVSTLKEGLLVQIGWSVTNHWQEATEVHVADPDGKEMFLELLRWKIGQTWKPDTHENMKALVCNLGLTFED